ncbi:MAG TPA: VOC family protein [Polyangia bacterium]|nr:VOC family protein [Polyangia bacterium]
MAKKKRPAPKTKAKPAAKAKPPAKAKAAPTAAARPLPAASSPAPVGVIHWELQSVDSEKQQAFYSRLFGWRIDPNNAGAYPMVDAAGPGSISAGFTSSAPGDPPRVTVYVAVPSVDAALARAVELGAQITLPRTILDLAVIGQFRDLEGNLIGLIES